MVVQVIRTTYEADHAMKSAMKSACPEMAVDLSAYFDGELAANERQRMEAHLEICAPCREALEGMSRLHDAFAALSASHPGGGRRRPLFQEIMARLDES